MSDSSTLTLPLHDLYPTWNGTPSAATPDPSPIDNAAAVGKSAHPMPYWIALIVALLVLKYAAEEYGDRDFSSIKIGFYNVFVITLAAIIGLNLTKLAVTKWPVPGLTTIVQAA
jgi:hypothetical protein